MGLCRELFSGWQAMTGIDPLFNESSLTDADLDRLVDNELSPEERRQLLQRLNVEPEGWRRCALSFLEAQAWSDALRGTPRAAAGTLMSAVSVPGTATLSIPAAATSAVITSSITATGTSQPASLTTVIPGHAHRVPSRWRRAQRFAVRASSTAALMLLAAGLGFMMRTDSGMSQNGASVTSTALRPPQRPSQVPNEQPEEMQYVVADGPQVVGSLNWQEEIDGQPMQIPMPIVTGANLADEQNFEVSQPSPLQQAVIDALRRQGLELETVREFIQTEVDNVPVLVPVDSYRIRPKQPTMQSIH